MRRAALLALDEQAEATASATAEAASETFVTERQIAAALHDLMFDGGALTWNLRGARLKVDGPGA